jgi:hypothetical protein
VSSANFKEAEWWQMISFLTLKNKSCWLTLAKEFFILMDAVYNGKNKISKTLKFSEDFNKPNITYQLTLLIITTSLSTTTSYYSFFSFMLFIFWKPHSIFNLLYSLFVCSLPPTRRGKDCYLLDSCLWWCPDSNWYSVNVVETKTMQYFLSHSYVPSTMCLYQYVGQPSIKEILEIINL